MNKKSSNDHSARLSPGSKVIIVLLALYAFNFPDHLLHTLIIVFHYTYEGLDFVVEEFLIHVLGFNKFYSQMVFFYLSCAAGIYAAYRCWLKIPLLLHQMNQYLHAQIQFAKDYWRTLPWLTKTAYIAAGFTLLGLYFTFFI